MVVAIMNLNQLNGLYLCEIHHPETEKIKENPRVMCVI